MSSMAFIFLATPYQYIGMGVSDIDGLPIYLPPLTACQIGLRSGESLGRNRESPPVSPRYSQPCGALHHALMMVLQMRLSDLPTS